MLRAIVNGASAVYTIQRDRHGTASPRAFGRGL